MIHKATLPVLAFLLLPIPLSGQTEVSSASARTAQFVFIVDDSGSMDTTDPDRLAVFAVRSLVNMLDDRDEVSVVRLNGPHDGEAPPPIAPLRRNRSQMLGRLALDKTLAHYDGGDTRCRSALEVTQRLLNDAYRPEVAQVVIFLTDGACTPAEETPDVERFLGGLRSHKDKLFQFYLLLFQSAQSTPAMTTLATATGGQAISVGGGDPTAILHPFATALSRSQGYKSYLLTPGNARLDAHRGAERVRLLAVAPGAGPPLALSIRDRQERSPQALGPLRTGTHRYGRGRVFRFAALDYRPEVEPVTVSVAGAGDGWKVVAVPEYRLSVRMSFVEGGCDRQGPPARHGVETGSTVCVVSELVNGDGEVVGGEVASGDLHAILRVRRPDQPGSPVTELTANPLPGDRARFGLLRSNLPKGDYEFQPVVTLSLSPEDAVHLRGRPMLLEVSSMEIRPQPDSFDFSALRPGQSVSRPLVLAGSFPPGSGRLEWRDRGELPGCISAELSGVPEGKSQAILVDQRYNLSLRAAPYCGPKSFRRPFDTVLRLVFEPHDGRRQLPAVELPVRFGVDYDFRAPRELVARVKAGEVVDLPLEVTGNFEGNAALRAVVAGPEDLGVAWTQDPEDLTLGFAGPERGELLRGEEDAPQLVHDFKTGAGGPPRLRLVSDRCCAGGAYGTRVGLAPATGQPIPEGAAPLEPTFVPVRIQVDPAGLWACYGPRILWVLAVLLLLLLLLYLLNMFRNSSFLKAEILASKLKPLVWTTFGQTEERKGAQREVLLLVRKALPFRARVFKWFQANPLRFGLPGGSYRETVELFLQPHRDVVRSQIVLQVAPDLQGRMARQPETYSGRLFATALGGATFLAVPAGDGRIGRLEQQDAFAPEDGKLRVIKLSKARLLKRLESWEPYEENTAAGWQVG